VGELRGLGRRAELAEHGGEAVRVVLLRHVAGVLEADEAAPGHRLVRGDAVRHGDDRVVVAPHDQRRQPVGEREPVGRAHPLPAGLDHRAQRVQEGLS